MKHSVNNSLAQMNKKEFWCPKANRLLLPPTGNFRKSVLCFRRMTTTQQREIEPVSGYASL